VYGDFGGDVPKRLVKAVFVCTCAFLRVSLPRGGNAAVCSRKEDLVNSLLLTFLHLMPLVDRVQVQAVYVHRMPSERYLFKEIDAIESIADAGNFLRVAQ